MNKQTNDDSSYIQRIAETYPEFVKDPYSWATMIERYEVEEKNWGDSSQMLRLVRWLATREYSSMFFPYTSLMTLCISTKIKCENRKEADMVTVWYDEKLRTYSIKYYKRSGKPEKRMCKESEVCDVIELKLLRMKITSESDV